MEEEKVSVAFKEHWIKYLFPAAIFIPIFTIGLITFYIAGRSAYSGQDVALWAFLLSLGFLLFAHHALFHLLLSEDISQIIVTNKRLIKIDERLFLRDDLSEIPMNKVRAVSATKHGILQLLLGYGTITFVPEEEIQLVPHPHRIAKDIMHVLEMS